MGLWASSLAPTHSTENNTVNNNNEDKNRIINVTKDQLPPEIEVSKILKEDKEAQELFCKCLKTHGYAIFKFDEQTNAAQIHENINALFKDREVYFQQDETTKMKNADPKNENIGYVNVKGIREYIKIRPCDGPDFWPQYPPTMQSNWKKVFADFQEIAWKLFLGMAQHDDEGTHLKDPEMISAIKEFTDIKSSISLIHYLPLDDPKACACSAHEGLASELLELTDLDTGIITFGVVGEVPGLMMWDRVHKGWVEVEKLSTIGNLVVFLGLKAPLYAGNKTWSATTHKVEIPLGVRRYSIVYLLDTAK